MKSKECIRQVFIDLNNLIMLTIKINCHIAFYDVWVSIIRTDIVLDRIGWIKVIVITLLYIIFYLTGVSKIYVYKGELR